MDFRIQRSTVGGLDETAYFWALIEPLWPDASVNDEIEHIALATPGQRALYVITLFCREVDNGGLNQFFSNSSGMYSTEVGKSFELIGAHQHASAFGKALEIFPNSEVPLDQDDRQSILNAIPKQRRKEFFEPFEDQLYGEERMWPYFNKYVDMHPNEFFVDDTKSSRGTRRTHLLPPSSRARTSEL